MPQERVITLVFCYQQRLVGNVRFHLKFALKVSGPTPFEKRRIRPISAYNISIVRASEKCLVIANKKRFSKSEFVISVNKIEIQSNKFCYKVPFCENFQ